MTWRATPPLPAVSSSWTITRSDRRATGPTLGEEPLLQLAGEVAPACRRTSGRRACRPSSPGWRLGASGPGRIPGKGQAGRPAGPCGQAPVFFFCFFFCFFLAISSPLPGRVDRRDRTTGRRGAVPRAELSGRELWELPAGAAGREVGRLARGLLLATEADRSRRRRWPGRWGRHRSGGPARPGGAADPASRPRMPLRSIVGQPAASYQLVESVRAGHHRVEQLVRVL